jgi:hypothetical protein
MRLEGLAMGDIDDKLCEFKRKAIIDLDTAELERTIRHKSKLDSQK